MHILYVLEKYFWLYKFNFLTLDGASVTVTSSASVCDREVSQKSTLPFLHL